MGPPRPPGQRATRASGPLGHFKMTPGAPEILGAALRASFAQASRKLGLHFRGPGTSWPFGAIVGPAGASQNGAGPRGPRLCDESMYSSWVNWRPMQGPARAHLRPSWTPFGPLKLAQDGNIAPASAKRCWRKLGARVGATDRTRTVIIFINAHVQRERERER